MSQQILLTPSTHAFSLVSTLDQAANIAKDGIVGFAGIPLSHVCQKIALSILGKIMVGELRIITSSDIYTFPRRSAAKSTKLTTEEPRAEIRVLKDSFWPRIVLMSDLGFAEAYMYGEVEVDCEDLIQLFKVR
ncbi:hypothetical protein FRC03_003089 [Tulasnella sp. 419]|nr:hypothetical protein FRC03_003089 [Tulasnella sp. 419]